MTPGTRHRLSHVEILLTNPNRCLPYPRGGQAAEGGFVKERNGSLLTIRPQIVGVAKRRALWRVCFRQTRHG